MRLLALVAVLAAIQTPPPAPAPPFERDIRPILERSCLRCHGAGQAQGGLRLDARDEALRGRRAIVPHDSGASELIHRVAAQKDEQRMPPPYSGLPRLSPREVATLRAWIDAGPEWPGKPSPAAPVHWSLRPLPAARTGSIDAFVRTRLAQKGLAPSPPADRRTLIRRVTFDLTGLPPTPAEVNAFIGDPRPDAYERVVDRLLASPRYGERWARHWLDTIHFADSHGFEHDIGRDNAWPYRDYVIAALNRDTPWPRFIREQLAADYFYPEQPHLTPALGFLGAGTFDLSAYTTAPKNFELLDRDDLVTQTMTAFVSTTANCARCHAHKFDPVSQSDYYALQAVFAGLIKGDRLYDATPQVAAERRKWDAALAAAEKRDPAILLAPENRPAAQTASWTPVAIASFSSESGSTLTSEADSVIVSGGKRPETDTYTTTLAAGGRTVTGVRLETLASDALPMHGPGRQDNGNLHLSEIEVRRGAKPVKIVRASADFNQDGWGIQRAIDGDLKTAWGIYPAVGQSHHAVFVFAEPQTLDPDEKLTVILRQLHGGGHLIGRYRLTVTDAPAERLFALPRAIEELLRIPDSQRAPEQRLSLAAFVQRERASAALATLPPPARVYAAGPRVEVPTLGIKTIDAPTTIHILARGDLDKPGETVGPGALSAITALPARFALANPADESSRRAALADWLASPKNPLTWRSIVNRVWQYHFGRGLCDTPSDLGKMGGTPSHPELLDWLAVWFRDDAKGSLKKLHRLLVTSQTYRQSAAATAKGERIDSENRLLWRQNRLRLDADSYRDAALAVSGSLDLTMGGPGVQHFKMSPGPQLTPSLDYASYDWNSPGAGRRSIYRYVWRGIADPFLAALDFPDLGLLTPTRSVSVSALQALALYNDPFVLHCSDALARRVAKEAPDLENQVSAAVRYAWLRRPTVDEQKAMTELARRDGLPALCRVLLNANEFLFVE